MRAVLISIRPYWCQKIARLLKTLELRKNAPQLKPPFKCYIYCTMGGELIRTKLKPHCKNVDGSTVYKQEIMNGKVIGEFICDVIEPVTPENRRAISEASCVPLPDMYKYAGSRGIYGLKGWHISSLVIYDEPRNLSEFYIYDNSYDNSFGWVFEDKDKRKPITRPPQSWCYIEEQSA